MYIYRTMLSQLATRIMLSCVPQCHFYLETEENIRIEPDWKSASCEGYASFQIIGFGNRSFCFYFFTILQYEHTITIGWLVVFVVAKVAGQRSICSIWFMRYYLFLIYLHVALILAFGQRSTIYFFFILLSSTFTAASDVHYWIEIEINGALNEARTAYRETIVT